MIRRKCGSGCCRMRDRTGWKSDRTEVMISATGGLFMAEGPSLEGDRKVPFLRYGGGVSGQPPLLSTSSMQSSLANRFSEQNSSEACSSLTV